jgi:NTE family protein
MKLTLVTIAIASFISLGCQLRTTKPIDKTKIDITPPKAEENIKSETIATSPNSSSPSQVISKPEQFGIIFSGGGVRTWSYINILKEVQKYKMPVVAVAGIEWGSVVAGVYAENVSANEVEWELSKFKSINDWSDYVKKVFEKKSTGHLKIPFACSSLNLRNQTAYVLNKGNLDSMVPFCMPAPGIANPYTDSIASMTDIIGLSQFLKANGATKVILVNALATRNGKPHGSNMNSIENQFWIQSAAALNKKNTGVDEVIEIDINNINVEKFDQRKDVLNSSIPNAKDQLKKIANKYGF